MENNEEAKKNQSQDILEGGCIQQPAGRDDLQAYKTVWRRVFNKRLKCYEVYIGDSNHLVATGIGERSDSFLIGALPLIVKVLADLCQQANSGEIDFNTYEEAKGIINRWKQQQSFPVKTGLVKPKGAEDAVCRIDLQQLHSPHRKLAEAGGGSYQADGCFDA